MMFWVRVNSVSLQLSQSCSFIQTLKHITTFTFSFLQQMILVDFVRHRDFNEGVRQGGATQLTSFICTIQFWPRPDALSHKYCFLHFAIS